MNSINTNVGAMVALQNLTATEHSLAVTQNRVNTGLKIASAADNGAIWAIAQTESAQAKSLDTVTNSLNQGKSVLDTTTQVGGQLTDILTQMRQDALAASDSGVSNTQRTQYQNEFNSLGQSYANAIASATFNGVNLIDSGSGQVNALGDANGTIHMTSNHTKLDAATVFGAVVVNVTAGTAPAYAGAPAGVDTVAAGATWADNTGTAAAAAMTQIDTAMTTVTQAMSGFGVNSKAMDNQMTLVSQLQDSLNTGVGNLVDANLAKESANLQALQTKQQLGVQALSIANQSTGILLGLFK
jgi:flagellin